MNIKGVSVGHPFVVYVLKPKTLLPRLRSNPGADFGLALYCMPKFTIYGGSGYRSKLPFF
jgi:hypothetical protein